MYSKIVAISVDKIQKYIYQRIDDMTSQGLNDNNTLSSILLASKEVKDEILKKIKIFFEKKEYKIEIEEFILEVSGKYIFKVNLNEDNENMLKNCLKSLFKKIYTEYGGQLFLKYTYFNCEEVRDKVEYIEKSIEYLKTSKVKSKVIEENKEVIFNFVEVENVNNDRYEENFEKIFAKDLDNLAPINNNDIKTRGKIAIIKADINNMGNIFEKIKSYDKYEKLSKLLKEILTLENFSEKVQDFNLENKILPFYVEGDDIFFAVKIGSLLESIQLLKSWINELREKIKDEKIGDEINIAISVGATFVDNHQPIRYYRKVVEQELAVAKYKMKEEKGDKAILGVCISGVSLFCYDGEKGKGENDGFGTFVKNVKKLNLFKRNKIISNSYFYNLLQSVDIEYEKNENQQTRTVLHKLLPDIKGENVQEKNNSELNFKYYLINQIIKKEIIKNNSNINSISFERIKNNLIPKLRLFILLTDERYSENLNIEDILKLETEVEDFFRKNKNKKKIKSRLFNKPIDYLYKEIKQKEILKLFVKEIKNKHILLGYKKAPFQLSFLYRIKSIIEAKENKDTKLVTVKNLFKNMCKIFEDIKNIKIENKNQNQIDYKLTFDFSKFDRLIKKEIENSEWIDILILFYSYSQQKVKYVSIYEKNKKQDNKKGKWKNAENKSKNKNRI